MKKFFDKRWEFYKSFFNVIFLKYFITWFAIVPIIVLIVGEIPDSITIDTYTQNITINTSLPFTWWVLWVSSLFYFAAFIIYLIFCPSFIKKYNNYGEYKVYDHDPRNLVWEAYYLIKNNIGTTKLKERLLEKKYLIKINETICSEVEEPKVLEKFTELKFKNDSYVFSFKLPIYIGEQYNEEAHKSIFWEIFGRYSESSNALRIIIMVLLVISASLFSVSLLQTLYKTFSIIYKQIGL